jgi:hypothetical protein
VEEVEVRVLLQEGHSWIPFLEGAIQEMQSVVFAFQTGIVQSGSKGRDVFLASFVLVAPKQPLRYCNQLRGDEAAAIRGFGLYQREDGDGTCYLGEFLTAAANARPRCITRQMSLR